MKASAQGNEHVVGNVALRKADLSRPGSIDVNLDSRQVKRLLDAQIGDARNVLNLGKQLVREFPVGLQIGTDHLDVDGRWHTEIEDLAHHVGRQKIEGDTRELACQHHAQAVDVLGCRPVLWGE